jgi:hypothetical protein
VGGTFWQPPAGMSACPPSVLGLSGKICAHFPLEFHTSVEF